MTRDPSARILGIAKDLGVIIMMMGHGICPKCEKPVAHCDLQKTVIGSQAFGPFFHGVAACCPHCKTILGVMPDPASVVADIVHEVGRKIAEKK
jgi:hypothetical protein